MTISETLFRNISDLFGDEGQQWLKNLPVSIRSCERAWNIHVGDPFQNLSYHFLAPALTAQKQPVVLKLGFPNPELASEIDALDYFNGKGCVKLLAGDRERGWLLLEQVNPGTLLSHHPDPQEMTRITAEVIRKLHQQGRWDGKSSGFKTVADWGKGFQRASRAVKHGEGAIPLELIDQAGELFRDLAATSRDPILLHGDLHHENILQSGEGSWLAVDPKGIIGEPEYEAGAYLRNHLPFLRTRHSPAREIKEHISTLGNMLGYNISRMLRWSFAQAVLAAWWTVEDHGYAGEGFLEAARQIRPLLQD